MNPNEVERYDLVSSGLVKSNTGIWVAYFDYESLRRATVSMETAQKLADALQLAVLNMRDAASNGIGQGGAIERANNALTQFNREKGGEG